MKLSATTPSAALALSCLLLAAGASSSSSSANAFIASSGQVGGLSRVEYSSPSAAGYNRTPLLGPNRGGGLPKSSGFPLPARSTAGTTTTSSQVSASSLAASVNGDSSSKNINYSKRGPPTIADSFLSASFLIALDVGFRKLFQALAISFPSSLGGCCALFASMLILPVGSNIFSILSPGAALLAKWLPVFFVPSLITLPLAGSIGPPSEILKIFSVIVVGFYFTLLSTAGSVVGIRKVASTPETEAGTSDDADAEEAAATAAATAPSASASASSPAPKPFSDSLVNRLRLLTVACGVGSVLATKAPATGPLASLAFLMATLHNFCVGARLPKSFTKIVHPLVTCTSLTWAMALLVAKVTGTTFTSMLKSYRVGTLKPMTAGPGDVLLFLLGPAVVSLAISMYDRRQLMKENLKEVVTGVGVSSVGGLFGTAAMVRLLQIASPALRLSLLSRNITSPLAMAIASLLGADVSLAVSMVVVTGLIGANFGASILTAFGVKDPVARGMGMGAAAHGLGTAAFVNEKDAFPFAAISMALTATACTCLVSVPVIKKAVLQLALGV